MMTKYYLKLLFIIHAAKIDENYSNKEREIIKKTLIQLGAEKSKINEIMNKCRKK